MDMDTLDRALEQSSIADNKGPGGDNSSVSSSSGRAPGASQLLAMEFQQTPLLKPGTKIVAKGRMMGALFGRSAGSQSRDGSRSSENSRGGAAAGKLGGSATSVDVGSMLSAGAAMSRDGPKAVRLGDLRSRSNSMTSEGQVGMLTSGSMSTGGGRPAVEDMEMAVPRRHFASGSQSAMGSPRNFGSRSADA